MSDLLSAMVRASKQVADPRAAAFASGNRPYQVTITRPAVLPTFNRDTNAFTNPVDQLIYSGPARISPASEGSRTEFGGEETTFTSIRVSIDDPADGSPLPRVDDLLTVSDDALSRSNQIAGRVFTITSSGIGGHFNVGLELSAIGVEPSRRS